MSFTLNPLKTVLIQDPVCDINAQREYGILKGGQEVSYKPFSTQSFSQNNFTFSAPPPNPNIIVNRKVYLRAPVKLTFTGTNTSGQGLLTNGGDAFRFMPLAQSMGTLQVRLNNTAVSINMSDVIEPLLRYNNEVHLRESEFSLSPSMPDQSQTYAELNGSNRNPLGNFYDSVEGGNMLRGGFVYKSVINNSTSATIEAVLTEELLISPLLFGTLMNSAGFIGLQTFDIIINWNNDLSRMWSHAVVGNKAITNINVEFGAPELLFNYITPSLVVPIPEHREYDYFEIQRYPTAVGQIGLNTQTRVSSANIQLQSIPKRMYVLGRKALRDRTFNDTDSYCAIESISINFNNRSGLLSSCRKEDLYNMSKKNGCNMSWTQWSAENIYVLGTANAAPMASAVNGPGSVLCVEFGTDIGLDADLAPGLNSTYQLQLQVDLKNKNTENYNVELWIIIVNEGIFTLEDNRAVTQIGVISKQDCLDAFNRPKVAYYSVDKLAGGASFLDKAKSIGSTMLKGATKACDVLETIKPVAHKLLGNGGVMVGGRKMSRQELADRL